MLNEKMEKALNEQLNAELSSAYLYYSMSAYFNNKGLPGCAKWMMIQAEEEVEHAQKFYNYIFDRMGEVKLDSIPKPTSTWNSILAVFEDAFRAESNVTARINNLVKLARELDDHASFNFLQWFVEEQVEEEASVDAVIQKVKLAGESGPAILMIDRELGSRTAD